MVFSQLKSCNATSKYMRRPMKKVLFLTLLVLSSSAFGKLNFITPTHVGEWVLNNKASQLNFITTKNASKTEIQSFKKLKGSIKNKHVILQVDLSSVDTGIEIRDQRLRDLFFKVADFPAATVTLDINDSDLIPMKQGQSKNLTLETEITLQGITQILPIDVQVIALERNQRLVFSRHPIIVHLKDFNLLQGVNQLRKLAKLTSINTAVPVTFSLLFSKP